MLQVEVDKSRRVERVVFSVPESKLDSRARMAISQLFHIPLPRGGSVPCKIKVSAKEIHTQKHGQCFRTSNGLGKVEIKCEDWRPEDAPALTFNIAVGQGEFAQDPRGPVTHNFLRTSVAGLPHEDADWDFRASVDPSTRSFDVVVEFSTDDGDDEKSTCTKSSDNEAVYLYRKHLYNKIVQKFL